MIIDLSEIIKDYGGKMSVSGPVKIDDTDFLGESFVFEKPFYMDGTIANNTKSLELTAKIEGEIQVHCARCGQLLLVPMKFRVHEILASEDFGMDSEDAVIFSGDKLDVSELVTNAFLMNVYGKYLCRDDCKGLCPKCGVDLNQGDCSCDSSNIDPRWAALQEIMDNMTDTE